MGLGKGEGHQWVGSKIAISKNYAAPIIPKQCRQKWENGTVPKITEDN
jgi:hypothetical protein